MSEQRDFFNAKAATWDDTRNIDLPKLSGLIERVGLKAGDDVLDVGCGTGVISSLLRNAVGSAGSVLGVDIAERMIAKALMKWGDSQQIAFLTADIMKLEPRRVDAIICLNVYPHFPQPDHFLQKMKAWLKPEGKLVIMHDKARKEINLIHSASPGVAKDRLPRIEEVEQLFSLQGYEVIESEDSDNCYFLKAVLDVE